MTEENALNVRQWEIWQVRWIHEDSTSKDRPAIAFMPAAYNAGAELIPFIKITSSEFPDAHRYEFSTSDPAFAHTGLRKDCFAYLALVQMVKRADILFRRGNLPPLSAAMLAIRIKRALPHWAPQI